MSKKSNNQGRAYEFAYLNILYEKILKYRTTKIIINSSYKLAKKAWGTLKKIEKDMYKVSALAGTNAILELEPLILDGGDDELELKIQTDDKGKDGDVRDVLIIRKGIE